MAATGIGNWTPDPGNTGTATITNPASPTTTITNFSIAGTYNFLWTVGGCNDTAAVTVTAKPDAGPDQNICQYTTATMAAVGTGTWTAVTPNPTNAVITNPASPTTTITALNAPGTYGFIWTSGTCTDTVNILVSQQPQIQVANTAICAGDSATLIPIAAPAGGTYAWSTGAATNIITVSPAATTPYSVTYTVGICAATATATVTINPLPVATVGTIAAVCTSADGVAIAEISTPVPIATYAWSSPGGAADTLSGLTQGSYTVTVTDVNNCSTTASGTVPLQTPAIIVNEISQHDLSCFNNGSGAIYISTTDTAGGAASYTNIYHWSNTPPAVTQNLTGVQAGSYSVTVTDQFGCTGTASYTITQPAVLTATLADTNPQCFGYANGTAAVTAVGGSGSYHYLWSSTPAQTTQEATGLPSGPYTVSVTDDSLCLVTLSFTLTDPQAITFSDSVIVDPSCFGSANGTAQVIPLSGIGTYSFSWSNGQTINPATALAAGTYTVTVTDANGCTAAASVTLTQPAAVQIAVSSTNVTCYGLSDGTATAAASGGTPPFSYVWNNMDSTASISGLVAASYSVSATDTKGCTISGSTTVIQPNVVTDSLASVRTNCPNSTDGSITAFTQGGTPPYTYTLENTSGSILQAGNTTGSFPGLGYGTYQIVASDNNNCPISDTISVPRAPYDVYTDTADGTSCYGSQYHDGSIHLQGYTIPNGPFQYSVDGGALQSSPDFNSLAAGAHTITAQDAYGCDTSFTVTVPEPLPAVLQVLPGDSTLTAGATLQLSSAFGPYSIDSISSYTWSPGAGLNCIDCPSPLASPYANQTTYTLLVTYNQGCQVSASVQITVNGQPPVYVPNAFTPNGDGVNDVWYVYGTSIKDVKATVFNKWGEKVFESDDQSVGWDGTYKGQLQPPGVYVYIVDIVYLNGETATKQGSLSVIR
jgi:gliding motility-associated-like protein